MPIPGSEPPDIKGNTRVGEPHYPLSAEGAQVGAGGVDEQTRRERRRLPSDTVETQTANRRCHGVGAPPAQRVAGHAQTCFLTAIDAPARVHHENREPTRLTLGQTLDGAKDAQVRKPARPSMLPGGV